MLSISPSCSSWQLKFKEMKLFGIILGIFLIFGTFSCKHTPGVPIDDNNGQDTTDQTGDTITNPCLPDVVYFERDVLPIIAGSCSYSGCHNAGSAADGIILDNYNNIIKYGEVRAGKPNDSELYEVITETDSKDVMPPPPAARLSSDQIKIIEKWILQGAKNQSCNSSSGCDTTLVTYQNSIKQILTNGCVNCHNASNAGGGIRLDNYTFVKASGQSGSLYGSVSWQTGYVKMPLGGTKINSCSIKKIKNWLDKGMPEN